MVKKIFRNTFITSLCGVIVAAVLIMVVFYGRFEEQVMESLKTEMSLTAQGVRILGEKYFESLEVPEDMRITWIDNDGTVLYDSVADENGMDNHSLREEIVKAVSDGEGEAIRYSDTLSEKTIYYAKLLGNETVLRISCAYGTVGTLMISMVRPLIFILVILFVIMYFVAAYTAKAIVAPINQIDLESGKIADVKGYVEIKPLLARIRRQNILIDTNIRELKHEHAKRESFRRDFTANVSHELKTPLTSISGISEMLMNGIIKPEDVPEFAENINKEAGRLINLVNDIILISRLEEEEMYMQKEQVNVVDVALSVKKRLEVIAAKKDVTMTVNVIGKDGEATGEDSKLPEIVMMGVYSMIEELIFNLCDNAIKYNVKYGHVSVYIRELEKQVEIAVEDTGIGIPDEDKKSIFERFYRVDKSRSKEVGGTGLGLSIVKHIALYHGGSVSVLDRQGGGTRMVAVMMKG